MCTLLGALTSGGVVLSGAVPPLVALLKTPKLWVLYAAVEAIMMLATDKRRIDAVVSAGVMVLLSAIHCDHSLRNGPCVLHPQSL